MRSHRFFSPLLALALGLCFLLPSPRAEARHPRARLSISVANGNVFLVARIRRRSFRRIRARGGRPVLRLWVRQSNGWTRLRRRRMRRHKRTFSLSQRRVCRGIHGNTRVALQLGVRKGRKWWNRWRRRWQSTFVSIRQEVTEIQCGAMPNDLPPGSPPQPGTVVAPSAPTEPAEPAEPSSGAPEPAEPSSGAPEPGAPAAPIEDDPNTAAPPSAPPPPPLVPKASFASFHKSMKDASFDKNRIRLLKGWSARLNQYRLRPQHIRRLLNTFSFDRYRLRGARILSQHVIRPLRTKEVVHIIKGFSFGSYKLKAAFSYCKGLEDSININVLANAFTFSRNKHAILSHCK